MIPTPWHGQRLPSKVSLLHSHCSLSKVVKVLQVSLSLSMGKAHLVPVGYHLLDPATVPALPMHIPPHPHIFLNHHLRCYVTLWIATVYNIAIL